MKQKLFAVVCFLFLTLWVVCLFNSNHTGSMHIALTVALTFFIRSRVVKKPALTKEKAAPIALRDSLNETQHATEMGG